MTDRTSMEQTTPPDKTTDTTQMKQTTTDSINDTTEVVQTSLTDTTSDITDTFVTPSYITIDTEGTLTSSTNEVTRTTQLTQMETDDLADSTERTQTKSTDTKDVTTEMTRRTTDLPTDNTMETTQTIPTNMVSDTREIIQTTTINEMAYSTDRSQTVTTDTLTDTTEKIETPSTEVRAHTTEIEQTISTVQDGHTTEIAQSTPVDKIAGSTEMTQSTIINTISDKTEMPTDVKTDTTKMAHTILTFTGDDTTVESQTTSTDEIPDTTEMTQTTLTIMISDTTTTIIQTTSTADRPHTTEKTETTVPVTEGETTEMKQTTATDEIAACTEMTQTTSQDTISDTTEMPTDVKTDTTKMAYTILTFTGNDTTVESQTTSTDEIPDTTEMTQTTLTVMISDTATTIIQTTSTDDRALTKDMTKAMLTITEGVTTQTAQTRPTYEKADPTEMTQTALVDKVSDTTKITTMTASEEATYNPGMTDNMITNKITDHTNMEHTTSASQMVDTTEVLKTTLMDRIAESTGITQITSIHQTTDTIEITQKISSDTVTDTTDVTHMISTDMIGDTTQITQTTYRSEMPVDPSLSTTGLSSTAYETLEPHVTVSPQQRPTSQESIFTTSYSSDATTSAVSSTSSEDAGSYNTVGYDKTEALSSPFATKAAEMTSSELISSGSVLTNDGTFTAPTTSVNSNTMDLKPTDVNPTNGNSRSGNTISFTSEYIDVPARTSDVSEPNQPVTATPNPSDTTSDGQYLMSTSAQHAPSFSTSEDTGATQGIYTLVDVTIASTDEGVTTFDIEQTVRDLTTLPGFESTSSQSTVAGTVLETDPQTTFDSITDDQINTQQTPVWRTSPTLTNYDIGVTSTSTYMVTDFVETTENKESIITTRRDLGADETTTTKLLSIEYSSLPFTIGYHTDEAFKTDSARTVTKNQVTVDTDDMTSTMKMSDNTATTVQDGFTSDEHSTSELVILSSTASTEGAAFETETFSSRSPEKLGTSQISDEITTSDFPFSSTATPINIITDETTTLRTITSTEYSSDAFSSGAVSTLNPLTDKATTKLQDISTWKSTEGVFETEEDFSSQALTINDDSTTDSSTSKPINDLTTLMITTADDMHPTTRKSFSETSEPSSTDQSFSDFGTTETDQTVGEYTTTGSSALITSPTFALTMETTIGPTPSESSTTTSITDSPSVPTLTYAETIYTTPITSGAVKSTTFLETRGLLTDGLSSDYTESLETSSGIHVTENAFTETTYQRVATDESTTYSEGASLEITSISVHTTQTEDAHVSTITTEATEQNPTTHTRTKEPCESCNQETETCVDGRCECRPSAYRTHVSDQCSGTRSFTFTFRIFLIDNDQALYTNDLRDKQSTAYQLLQTDLVKSVRWDINKFRV
ncbi:mucin-3A-like [Lytechinus variegatus]|uniref:mucin-3A-like n=1 Tax=Lytechinus variegatus TaxID=7654 RepID=UPI001BB2B7F3|nr:mucin-3A-like [Lytechinus variegatus]